MSHEVKFNYEKLQKDLGFLASEVPALFEGVFGERITKSAVYGWFERERMTVGRLIQLLTIVRIETEVKLDVWRYIEVTRPVKEQRVRAA